MKKVLILTNKNYFLVSLIMSLMLLLGGCTYSEQPKPPLYYLKFSADKDLNRDDQNRPSPVKIRVFKLNSISKFMTADFFLLQSDATAVLGEELQGSEQFFLLPGQEELILIGQGQLTTTHIGIMAEYQHFNNKVWRFAVPFSKTKLWFRQKLELQVIAGTNGLYTKKLEKQ